MVIAVWANLKFALTPERREDLAWKMFFVRGRGRMGTW
jgi:hypothetical protein